MGVYPSIHRGDIPAVDRITDRCKNITFPQFRLPTVKKHLSQQHTDKKNWTEDTFFFVVNIKLESL